MNIFSRLVDNRQFRSIDSSLLYMTNVLLIGVYAMYIKINSDVTKRTSFPWYVCLFVCVCVCVSVYTLSFLFCVVLCLGIWNRQFRSLEDNLWDRN